MLALLLISNPSIQNELTKLFRSLLHVINYDFIEKECEKHLLLLSDKTQNKGNKTAAARMIGFISEVLISVIITTNIKVKHLRKQKNISLQT